MATNDETRGSSKNERLYDHVVRAITVAGVIGGVIGFFDLREELAVQGALIQQSAERISDLRAAATDRYTGEDARRDLGDLRERLSDHENRLRTIERNMLVPGTPNQRYP